MGESEARLAFGPVGAAGLVLLLLALVRRSSGLAAAGLCALAADVTLPQLRGFAAMHNRAANGPAAESLDAQAREHARRSEP